MLVGAMVHAADIQDRDGAPALLASIRSAFPWLRHVFADGGGAGRLGYRNAWWGVARGPWRAYKSAP